MRRSLRPLFLILLTWGCGSDVPESLPMPDLSQAPEADAEAHQDPATNDDDPEGNVAFTHEEGLEGLGQKATPQVDAFQPIVVPIEGSGERTWEWEFKAKPRRSTREEKGLSRSGKQTAPFSELIDDEREAARLRARGR